jgi:hypothetical protein
MPPVSREEEKRRKCASLLRVRRLHVGVPGRALRTDAAPLSQHERTGRTPPAMECDKSLRGLAQGVGHSIALWVRQKP